MSTLYGPLLKSSGLSIREAAEFHGVRLDTVKGWSSGRRTAPESVLTELADLVIRQERAALKGSNIIADDEGLNGIEIGIATDDHEAQSIGWPCVSAQAVMIGRLIAMLPPELFNRVTIVPRGSSPESAAAIDAHA